MKMPVLFASLLATLLLASVVRAEDEVNVSSGATLAGPGLAAHGYDVVAYFTDGKPTIGSDKFAVAVDGATYRFASQANLDAFQADPAKYQPAYGGFCAYGAALNKKFDGDPRLWRIVDGKLYFNLNEDVVAEWSKDIPGNIATADSNWAKIRAVPADKL
jgi:YHS domain-containing protein